MKNKKIHIDNKSTRVAKLETPMQQVLGSFFFPFILVSFIYGKRLGPIHQPWKAETDTKS